MVEGPRAGEEHVAHDAQRPHVHGAIVFLGAVRPQLGRHIGGGAYLVPHALLAGRDEGCEAEVNELELRHLILIRVRAQACAPPFRVHC